MTKAIKEFREKHKHEDKIEHVVDFLMAEYNHKESINFSYEQALEKANFWTQRLNEKSKDLKKSGEIEIIREYDGGFKIVRLIDQTSKDWEGLHMGHCVAAYTIHQGIYSLRDSSNLPHCTIEIKDNEIKQIKGKGNGLVSPKYVNFVIDFIQSINLELSNNDIENLGYTNEIDLKFIKKHFSNYKIIKIKDKDFLYIGNKLQIVKNFRSKNENLLFHFCRYNQCFDAVKLFVENGVNQCYSNKALCLASSNGHLEIVKFLVENGADIREETLDLQKNINDFNSCFLLIVLILEFLVWILYSKYIPVILLFFVVISTTILIIKSIKKGTDLCNFNNQAALHLSRRNGHLDVVNFLVEKGVKEIRTSPLSFRYKYKIRS